MRAMRTLGVLLTTTALLAGCATKRPVRFPSNFPERPCKWERVLSIPVGSDVRVMTDCSTPGTRGGFVSADETRIVLAVNGLANEIPRRSVTRVVTSSSKPYAKFVRLGALSGGVLGTGLLVEAGGAPPVGAMLFSAAWATKGAAVGTVAAWRAPNRKVVYDAQSCNAVYP